MKNGLKNVKTKEGFILLPAETKGENGNKKDLKTYLHNVAEAEKRDHRRLSRQLDLFHIQEEAPGQVFWHPKGWTVYQTIEQYMREQQRLRNTEWQRDLSVSYDRVGDMHKANGDGVSALKAYEDGLAIAKKLAELDPKHTEWQRDLSVSHNKVGDMHKANGDGVSALKAYEESLAIRKKLAELNPEIVEWQTDLVVSYYKLSTIQVDKTQELLGEALAILKRLHAENRLDHEIQGWIPFFENALKQ